MFASPLGSSCSTGIEEQNDNTTIKIYPNPAQEELYIKNNSLSEKEKAEIIITYVSGRIVGVQNFESPNSEIKINISGLNNGIYFCQIIYDDALSAVQKLIVAGK